MPFEGGHDRLAAVFRVALVNLNDCVEPGSASGGDGGPGAANGLVYLGEYRRLPGHTHEHLVLEPARQEGMVNGVSPVSDQIDFNHRLLPDDVEGFGQVHKRSFAHTAPGDASLEYDLGVGRNVQVVAQAGHQGRWRQGMGHS